MGLGAGGRAAEARALALASAGFTPPVVGAAYGFLVQPWRDDARPLSECRLVVSRPRLLATLGEYLACRAKRLPATADRGAPLGALYDMAVGNANEKLGRGAARALHGFEPWLDALARERQPIEIDGRLHAWEWLVLPDGRLWKADAIDHCDGHDLVGCQDVAWDLAGASVELELEADEVRQVRRRLARGGAVVEDEALAFHRAAYLAFQLGFYRLGAASESDPADAARLGQAAEGYARRLAAVLGVA